MHNSKLLSLLKSLTPTEIHWLEKFLKSPFYNSHKLPLALFRYIQKYYPNLDSPKLEKAIVFKKLFPKEPYNVQKMRKTMYELAVLVEEFLIAMHLRNHSKQKEQLLRTALGRRNVYNQFEKRAKALIKDLETLPYKNAEVYKEMYELNLHYYGHIETAKQKENLPILSTAKTYLDYFYLLQSQRLEIVLKGNEKLFGEIPNLDQSRLALEEEPTFKLYELMIAAISTPENDLIYEKIEHLFKKEIQHLARRDQLEIIRMILNHFSAQINRGKARYHTKMLSLYKFGLVQNLMMEKGLMGATVFINIATVGIIEKEFDWVEQFIKDYTNYLPDSIQEDATRLSQGLLYFYQKEYRKAIDLLLHYIFLNPLYALNAKTILLRIYFEKFLLDRDIYDFLLDHSLAFERFVKRNQSISEARQTLYLNFIVFVKKIAKAYLDSIQPEKIAKELSNTKSVALKAWLLEKIEGLK